MKLPVTACLIVLLLGATIAGASFGGAQAATTSVEGVITADTTWTKAGGIYNLTGPVTVNNGATLTVEAGVTVSLNTFYLMINGTLNARGTSSDPINFHGGEPISTGGWAITRTDYGYSIVFSPSSTSWSQQTQSGSIIENAVIGNLVINGGSPKIGGSFLGNIDIYSGNPEISDNNVVGGIGVYAGSAVIVNNTVSQQYHYFLEFIAQRYDRNNNIIIITRKATPSVLGNVIVGTISQAAQGIGFETENATIRGNTIFGCYGAGIGFYESAGNAVILDNTIYDCAYGISTNDTGSIYSNHQTTTTIQRNLIYNNTWGIASSLSVTVENNTIKNNTVGTATSALLTFAYNNLEGNNQNLYLSSSNNLDAANNWWGTTEESAISNSIYDSKNNSTLGTVTFVPYLTEPNTQALPNSTTVVPIPSFSPTPSNAPTLTPTPPFSPSGSLSPSPTPTGSQSSTQSPPSTSGNGIGLYEILVGALVVLVAAFAVVVALLLRRRNGDGT